VRRGRVEDRQVRERAQRPALLAFTLASVAVGLVVLRLLHAPRDLFEIMAAMVAGMAITLLVSTFWKISIHASCVAGVITSLALLVDGRAWWLGPLVLVTAWSRMLLRHHALAQVAVGTIVDSVVAGMVLSILT
jgi:membrane-associated phospholipid phosphatase